MSYCAKDVFATYEVFKKLTKIYSERLSKSFFLKITHAFFNICSTFYRFEHSITFGGMLELGSMYLPIDQAWLTLKIKCQLDLSDTQYVLQKLLEKSANEACEFFEESL